MKDFKLWAFDTEYYYDCLPRVIAVIMLGLMLLSCTAQNKLRRAERLIKKAEEQGAIWKADTVYQSITVTTPQIDVDTVFRDVHFTDTLVLTKNKVVTKVKINTVTRQVYVKTKCPEQTRKVIVTHTVTKTIKVGDGWVKDTLQGLAGLIAGLLIGAIASKMFWK
jgi:hypothetical protein